MSKAVAVGGWLARKSPALHHALKPLAYRGACTQHIAQHIIFGTQSAWTHMSVYDLRAQAVLRCCLALQGADLQQMLGNATRDNISNARLLCGSCSRSQIHSQAPLAHISGIRRNLQPAGAVKKIGGLRESCLCPHAARH